MNHKPYTSLLLLIGQEPNFVTMTAKYFNSFFAINPQNHNKSAITLNVYT